jgi:D-xylose transport system permease protein
VIPRVVNHNMSVAASGIVLMVAVDLFAAMMCCFTGGLAALVYESRLGSMATDIDGGTLVLYDIASAVIGGTNVFGGPGKAEHAVLGGLVIAAVEDGRAVIGIGAAGVDTSAAPVLIGAVTVDSPVRRRGPRDQGWQPAHRWDHTNEAIAGSPCPPGP